MNFKAKFYWEGPPEAKILRICALSMAKMFHIQDSFLCCVLKMVTLATIDCMIMIWPNLTAFGGIRISIGHWTPKYNSKQFRNKVDNLHCLNIVQWIHRCGSKIQSYLTWSNKQLCCICKLCFYRCHIYVGPELFYILIMSSLTFFVGLV